MTDDDVPAQVMAALQDSHLLSPSMETDAVASVPDWWERLAAHHQARADAFRQLDRWADETRQPVAVRVAISEVVDVHQIEARRCRGMAEKARQLDTDH